MPLGKSLETPPAQPTQPVPSPSEPLSTTMAWEGVPIDVYRFFGLDFSSPDTEIEKVRDIYLWASDKNEEKTIGNILSTISSLEHQLGSPSIRMKRYDKLWQWVKMSKNIDDLTKARESLIGR